MKPEEIEEESFRIIDFEAGDHGWPGSEWQVVRRAIHTSADFEYARSMVFSDDAVEKGGRGAQERRRHRHRHEHGPVRDQQAPPDHPGMCGILPCCRSGRGRTGTKPKGSPAPSPPCARRVANRNNRIFVIGNAPTALFELLRLVEAGTARPVLIIGLPVGFVGAEESKNALASGTHDIPFITNIGRKGGSNVAAAVVNALAILAASQQ